MKFLPTRSFPLVARLILVGLIQFGAQHALALPAYEKVPALAKASQVSIYPESRHPRSNARDWCGSRTNTSHPANFGIVYEDPHSQREALFPKGYEDFAQTHVRPVLAQQCETSPEEVVLFFYRRGEFEYYDKKRFRLTENGQRISARQIRANENQKHPQYQERKAESNLGTCSREPFCSLSGGVYLNAIFENDLALIRKLDQQVIQEIRSGRDHKDFEKFTSIITGQYKEGEEQPDIFDMESGSLLKEIAVKYMAQYGEAHGHDSRSGQCLQDDARRIVRKDRTKVVHFQNQLGIDQGSVGGIEFGEVYTINPEFVPLCEKICDSLGDDGINFFAESSKSWQKIRVIEGVGELLVDVDCNRAEVKEFERNLISLTMRQVGGGEAWATSTGGESSKSTAALREPTSPSKRAVQPSGVLQREEPRKASPVAIAPPQFDERVLRDYDGNVEAGVRFFSENLKKQGVIQTPSGLQYVILKMGTGSAPAAGDRVTVHMVGSHLDGQVLLDTHAKGKPETFRAGQKIAGVNEGIRLLKPGGKVRIFVPPSLAYGRQAMGTVIPAGASLIYEIELLDVK